MTQVTTAQANKILQAALFTEANRSKSFANLLTDSAPKDIQPDGASKQTSFKAPVVRVTDLEKTPGDEVSVTIFHNISGRPTMGDKKLVGRLDNLSQTDFGLKIQQGRHGVDAGGKMSQQRTKHNLRKVARTLLTGSYYNRLQDQIMTFHLAGARGSYVAPDIIVPLEDDPEFREIMVNDILPPTYDRHFFGGDATSLDTLDSADQFSMGVVDNIVLMLAEMAAPMTPVKFSSDEMADDDPFFVLNVTPRQWNDFYTSSTGKDWQTMMAAAMNRSKGFNHPLFKGQCAMWRNVLVRQMGGAPVRFNTGDLVTVSNNDNVASTKQVTVGTTVDRAILLGGQAIALAYGSQNGSTFGYHEEKSDHDNATEISISWVNGLKKIRFADRAGRINDLGVMVVDTAVTKPR
jgi:N4-gp56 family major capsid protein